MNNTVNVILLVNLTASSCELFTQLTNDFLTVFFPKTAHSFGFCTVTVSNILQSKLGCSLFLKSDLNFMGIISWALFTKLGELVVESRVFYIGNDTPRPTHLGGKRKTETVFFKVLVNLHSILPSILIIYPIEQYYIPFNTSICLEINICGKHLFGGKNDQFCIYPLSEHGWRAFKQIRAPFDPIITCVSVNEESLCYDSYDTMSYWHFLRIKYHFSWNYFAVKFSKML